MDAALSNGANLLLGVDYQTQNPRPHRDEARRMAVKAAREKAELLAAELNEKLGRVRTLNESNISYFSGGLLNSMGNSSRSASDGDAASGETIPVGKIGIRASVNVVFDLAD